VPLALTALSAGELREELGRSEVRVRSEAYPLVAGRTVAEIALVERLGYERVSERPQAPGRFFYGHEVFWIYRHAQRAGGKQRDAGQPARVTALAGEDVAAKTGSSSEPRDPFWRDDVPLPVVK